MVGRGHVGDVDDLHAAGTVGHQGQVAAAGEAVDIRVGHVDAAHHQVGQAELAVAVALAKQQQLAGLVVQVEGAGAFARGVAAVPVLADLFAELVDELAGRVPRLAAAGVGDAGLAGQHDVLVGDQFADGAAEDLGGAVEQRRVGEVVALLVALGLVHRIHDVDAGARFGQAAQSVFLAQQAEALLDAQRVDAGPGGDHGAAAVEGAVLVDGGVVHALGGGLGTGLGRDEAALAQRPAHLVVGVAGDGVVRRDHLGQQVQALVAQAGTAQHVALAEVGPVDVVVLVRVADRGGVARLALVVAEQGQRVLVGHLPFAGVVLVFAAPEHVDVLDGAAHVFDGHHRPQAFAHGQHVLVDRVEHGEARHHGVFELADAHHLGLARLAQRVVGDGLDGEALDARRRGEARAVDVVLGVAADLLPVALLGGDDRYAVDVEGDVVDALGAEVVEGLDEDFEILAVDHHGVVIVGLDDARLRRLVGLDQDAAGQVHHGGLIAVEVAGLGAEAQHLVDTAGGHLEVELVGRGGILAQGLVGGRGAGRADGVVERGAVDADLGVAGLDLDHDATALGQLGDLAHGEAAGVQQLDGVDLRRLVAQQVDRDDLLGLVAGRVAGGDLQLHRQGFGQLVGAAQVVGDAGHRQAADVGAGEQQAVGDALLGSEGAVAVAIDVQAQAHRADADVVADFQLVRQVALLGDAGAAGQRLLDQQLRRLVVLQYAHAHGLGRADAAALAVGATLQGAGGEAEVGAGLAVGHFDEEFVGEDHVGEAAVAALEAADVEHHAVDADVVHGVDFHQQQLAFGGLAVVLRRADHHAGQLVAGDFHRQVFLGAVGVEVAMGDAVGVHRFQAELHLVGLGVVRVEGGHRHGEVVGRLAQAHLVGRLAVAVGGTQVHVLHADVVEGLGVDVQRVAFHDLGAGHGLDDVDHRAGIDVDRVAVSEHRVVGRVEAFQAHAHADPLDLVAAQAEGADDLGQAVDVDQLAVFGGVDVDGGDRLVVLGGDAVDGTHHGEGLLAVLGFATHAHRVAAREHQAVDLDVVEGLVDQGEVAVLDGAEAEGGPLEQQFRADGIGHHLDLALEQADRAVGVLDLGGELQFFVMADQALGHFQHEGALHRVGAVLAAEVVGHGLVVAGMDAVVDAGEGGIDHLVATGDAVAGADHRQRHAIGEDLEAAGGELAVVRGHQADADAEGAGGDLLVIARGGDAHLGDHVGQRVDQDGAVADMTVGVGQFDAVFGGLALVEEDLGLVGGLQRRRGGAVDLEAALVDHGGDAAVAPEAQDAVGGEAGVVTQVGVEAEAFVDPHPEFAVVDARRVGEGLLVPAVHPVGVEAGEAELRLLVGGQRVAQAVFGGATAPVLGHQGELQFAAGELAGHLVGQLLGTLAEVGAEVVDDTATVLQQAQALQAEAVVAEGGLEVQLLHGHGDGAGHRADDARLGRLLVDPQGLLQQGAEHQVAALVGEAVGGMADQAQAAALHFGGHRQEQVVAVFRAALGTAVAHLQEGGLGIAVEAVLEQQVDDVAPRYAGAAIGADVGLGGFQLGDLQLADEGRRAGTGAQHQAGDVGAAEGGEVEQAADGLHVAQCGAHLAEAAGEGLDLPVAGLRAQLEQARGAELLVAGEDQAAVLDLQEGFLVEQQVALPALGLGVGDADQRAVLLAGGVHPGQAADVTGTAEVAQGAGQQQVAAGAGGRAVIEVVLHDQAATQGHAALLLGGGGAVLPAEQRRLVTLDQQAAGDLAFVAEQVLGLDHQGQADGLGLGPVAFDVEQVVGAGGGDADLRRAEAFGLGHQVVTALVVEQAHFVGGDGGVVLQADLQLGLLPLEEALGGRLDVDLRAGLVAEDLDVDGRGSGFVDAAVTGAQHQLQHLAGVAAGELGGEAQAAVEVGVEALADEDGAEGAGVGHLDGLDAVLAAEQFPGHGVFFAGVRVDQQGVEGVDVLVVPGAALDLEVGARRQAEVAFRLAQLQGRRLGVVDDFQFQRGFADLVGAVVGTHGDIGVGPGLVGHA
ncbi:hypothetical protein thsps21_52410 [Pseudomonas sp. No.21]